jgi:TonB family protein
MDVSNQPKPAAAPPPVVAAVPDKPAAPVAVAKNSGRGRVVYHNGESSPVSPPQKPDSILAPHAQPNASLSSLEQAAAAAAAANLMQLQNGPPPANEAALQSAPAFPDNTPGTAAPPRSKPERPETPRTDPQRQPAGTGTQLNPWDASGSQEKETAAASTTTDAKAAFVAPRPLLQVMPNTRSLSPGLITQVTRVEVEVRIDDAGHVASARVLNDVGAAKGALSGAAVSAARQWTFQPATLRGEKVESQHTIVFEFRPENQE